MRPDLLEILENQVAFLVSSSKAFDAGFEGEGVRLAAVLRVLMHETAASHSLLGQIGLRDRMLYLDTAFPYSSGNLVAESGLTLQGITAGGADGTSGRYLPSLSRPPVPDRWSGVRRWWELNSVIRDSRGERFTRKDLVLYAAHEDGGAHVQPELTERYRALTRDNSMGYQLVDGGVSFGIGPAPTGRAAFDWENGPALPSVRMIAHEIRAG
ncbi:MAG: hypothetical protein O3B31_14500 [Chloroflexi bacterium]|nr:hypothetical protein [Chloroflexota bacterium]MDA1004532.1 hypothetical protein [Chloroflexota bacterium]